MYKPKKRVKVLELQKKTAIMVIIRLASINDAEAIASIYSPFVKNTSISFEIVAPPVEVMAKRISEYSSWCPWLVAVDDNNDILGYAYATRFKERWAYQWSAEVSVYTKRKGVGRRMYEILLQVLRMQG